MRLKEKLLKVANFLRLIDENALLSITNIAVIVVVVKVAIATDLDFSDVAALLAVLGGYSFKRHANKDKVATPGDEFVKRLDDIENKVGAVGVAVGMKPPRRR